MKLIIDIPEDVYDGLINNKGVVIPNYWHEYVTDLCKNGTPLPKGHGRLIDADALENHLKEDADEWDEYALARVKDAPTIVEADKRNNETNN